MQAEMVGRGDTSKLNPDRIDPFASLSLLYFLPASIKTQEGAVSAANLDEPEALHEFLKSRVSNISRQLPVQVPGISDSRMKLTKDAGLHHASIVKDPSNLEKLCRNYTVPEGKENDLQNRRPGLGCKKARFSLKPLISENVPVISGKPSLDQLENPDEFFAAYGRQENAEKELRRLQGSNFLDHTSDQCVSGSRMRRQGLLGRTAKYKHSYAAICDNELKHISSVGEPRAQTSFVSSSASPLVELNNQNHDAVNDTGSTENNDGDSRRNFNPLMKNIDDELLGSLRDACHDLNEGQTFDLLHKSLNIEEIDMHKIQFPKFNRFSLSSQTSMLKSIDSVGVNMTSLQQTWISTISDITPTKSHSDLTPRSPMTSPTPPKSPFAAISSFCMKKSAIMTKGDPFRWSSKVDIPCSVAFFAPRSELDMPSSQCDDAVQYDKHTVIPVGNVATLDAINDVSVFSNTCSGRLEEGSLESRLHSQNWKTSCLLSCPAGPSGPLDLVNAPSKASSGISEQNTRKFVGHTSPAHADEPFLPDGFPSKGPEEGIDRTGSHLFSMQADSPNCSADQSQANSKVSDEAPNIHVQSQMLTNKYISKVSVVHPVSDQRENEHSDPHNLVQVLSVTGGDQLRTLDAYDARNDDHCLEMPMDDSSISASGISDEFAKGTVKNVDREKSAVKDIGEDNVQVTVNSIAGTQDLVGDDSAMVLPSCSQQASDSENATGVACNPRELTKAPSKAIVRKKSKKVASAGRKSLIGAGTEWKSGLRRSTRIRSRPLEYWRGERFVYGRVHSSLVTVIGVKCSSPVLKGKERPTLKVKSFVPDKYSDLVNLAGSH